MWSTGKGLDERFFSLHFVQRWPAMFLSIEERDSNSTFKTGLSESEEDIGSIKKENGRRRLIDKKNSAT
jgi:hypothetical protein